MSDTHSLSITVPATVMNHFLTDEGFTDDEDHMHAHGMEAMDTGGAAQDSTLDILRNLQLDDREGLVYKLLESMPRSHIAKIHRHIAPFLHFDIVSMLPSELSLLIFSHLSWRCLLKCALVSKAWKKLANDQALWKYHCEERGWRWKQPTFIRDFPDLALSGKEDFDDEGMGDDEDELDLENDRAMAILEPDSGMGASQFVESPPALDVVGLPSTPRGRSFRMPTTRLRNRHRSLSRPTLLPLYRHSAPCILPPMDAPKPDYKMLHQTHILLLSRMRHGRYRHSTLQVKGAANGHTSLIYCLQLYTYPETGCQVLFTGSKDRTIREWNLQTGIVERVFEGGHTGSVLSLCVHEGFLATAGSDRLVCLWDLQDGKLLYKISDHSDSVLSVRFDDNRLVSCSKDSTIRTYSFPYLLPDKILSSHRAAVNAVAISGDTIVSASGDKSMRIWDANTGELLKTFENHHMRGLAAIDFEPPNVLSGSSDKHIRFFNLETQRGWSTFPEYNNPPTPLPSSSSSSSEGNLCESCGSNLDDRRLGHGHGHTHDTGSGSGSPENANGHGHAQGRSTRDWGRSNPRHTDLVRSVAIGADLVLSGSYDQSIKVWDRQTGELVTNLAGHHEGRIFCIGFDCTKIISCGEDEKICIWDFSHGVDTSFIKL